MKLQLHLCNLAVLAGPVALLVCLSSGAQDIQVNSKDSNPAPLLALASTQAAATHPKVEETGKPVAASPTDLKAWAKTMHHTHPPKVGCFQSAYPSTEWQEVQCAPPNGWRSGRPGKPGQKVGSHGGAFGPFSIPPNSDIVVQAPTGDLFSTVVGSFPTVNGVTSESDASGISPGSNEYSLQLNSNDKYTNACGSSTNCFAWVQFVMATNTPVSLAPCITPPYSCPLTNQTQVFIEYWLFNYGTDGGHGGYVSGEAWQPNICPSGFLDNGPDYLGGAGDDCVQNSPAFTIPWNPPTNLGQLPITDLADLSLSGSATAGGNDEATVTYDGLGYNATVSDSTTDLASIWSQAEFNVLGNAGTSEAVFNGPTSPTLNNGSTVVVQSAVTYTNGSMSAPTCVQNGGTTGETNNLAFAPAPGTTTPTCCPYSGSTPGIQGTSPGIQFVESNNPNEWAVCPAPITWGDPHITTVDGTIYDFQGAGEYVALQDTDGTEVQVRQSPIAGAAPGNWAPASAAKYQNDGLVSCLSSNTAVAAKVGTHRVTYEPSFGVPKPSGLQLRIDGKVASTGENFGDGGSVETTSDGIEIHFPDGKLLSVSGSLPYLSLDFSSLGVVSKSAGASESGLAGVVPNDNWLPRLPNGTAVGAMPTTLHERYVTLNQKFGNAWRVTKSNSLFDYAPGDSTATFTNTAWPVENAKSCTVPSQKPAVPVTTEAAEEACKSVKDVNLHSSCVFDVKATGITHLAETYATTERIHLRLAPKPILIKPILTDIK